MVCEALIDRENVRPVRERSLPDSYFLYQAGKSLTGPNEKKNTNFIFYTDFQACLGHPNLKIGQVLFEAKL